MEDKNYTDLSELIGKRVIRCDSDVGDDKSSCEVGIIVHAWVDTDLEAKKNRCQRAIVSNILIFNNQFK